MSQMATRGRWVLWEALGARLSVAAAWVVVLLALSELLRGPPDWVPDWLRAALFAPDDTELQTIVQVVPAVVIAIFVFAAGTLFVVAQVVPPARGTRAVENLRGRHLAWTLSPALALTPLSALVLVRGYADAWPLSAALLLGAVFYLFASTACLLAILGEATDPILFASYLSRRQSSALRRLRRSPWPAHGWGLLRWPSTQSAVNVQYDVVRALRGWARTAANSGDSRELHVCLHTTLELINDYTKLLPADRPAVLPRDYDDNSRSWQANPMFAETTPRTLGDDDKFKSWELWVPPPCPSKPSSDAPHELGMTERVRLRGELAKIWVANEVGRSLVRAVEFATTSKTLLDRDRGRLILTMDKAARRFGETDPASCGVLVAYLVELGLGARRCPPDEVMWHFEPLVALASLHRRFCAPDDDTHGAGTVPVSARNEDLVIGTAGAVIKVTEAIAQARAREHLARNSPDWDGTFNSEADQAEADKLVTRTVAQLRAVPELDGFFLFDVGAPIRDAPKSSEALAKASVLDPRDHPVVHPTNEHLASKVADELRQTPGSTGTSAPTPLP